MIEAVCSLTNKTFQISDAEEQYCHSYNIPLSTLHPIERLRKLFSFQNRSHLYHDTCKKSGAKILTSIPPQKGFIVYDSKVWEGDDWDPLEYGRDYDPNKSFFEQFRELQKVVPVPNLSGAASTRENSDFVSGVSNSRNCYLVMGGTNLEDCYYCKRVEHCKNLIDCCLANNSELCFECGDIRNCYNLKFSTHCTDCSDSTFLTNCRNCSDCYGCVNLIGAKNHFYNEELSPEAYAERIKEVDLSSKQSFSKVVSNYKNFVKKFPRPASYGIANEDSMGSFLNNSKNCKNSYFSNNCQDLEHCFFIHDSHSCFYYCAFGSNSELIYETVSAGINLYNVKFSSDIRVNVRDVEYCMFCAYGVKEAFGCIGLRRLSNCILNKQYSKKDYDVLLTRIKSDMTKRGEYGNFFPSYISPYFFNQSGAMEFLPLEKSAAVKKGFSWIDEENVSGTGDYSETPNSIDSIENDKAVYRCTESNKYFKLLPEELKFLKENRLRPPCTAPLVRLEKSVRLTRLSPLIQTQCCKCRTTLTTMDDGKNDNVACSECILDASQFAQTQLDHS